MAISKIKALSNRLDNAINYVKNFDKTENGELIFSFACSTNFANEQMELTRKKSGSIGNRVGYHLIQSFDPEDPITPEQAFVLGKEFADKVLGGNYQYVLATHSDKKHIHNHIIFNSVSYVSKKKYHWNYKERDRIMGINDSICRREGLSVIEETSGDRGKTWYEWNRGKANNSWKEALKLYIDDAIKLSDSFEDFERIINEEFKIKTRIGKTITFKFNYEGDEFSCRDRRLGDAYSIDSIKERIKNGDVDPLIYKKNKAGISVKVTKIRAIVDVTKNAKAMTSIAYANALYKNNATQRLRTFNYIRDLGFETSNDFLEHVKALENEKRDLKKQIEESNVAIKKASETIEFYNEYKENKKYYDMYLEASDKEKMLDMYSNELAVYEASIIFFESKGISNLSNFKIGEAYATLKNNQKSKNEAYEKIQKITETLKEYNPVIKNLKEANEENLSKNEIRPNEKNEKSKTIKNRDFSK